MTEPGITLQAAHFDNVANPPIDRIVIHATAGGRGYPSESAAGTARATAEYFQKSSAGGSAHYIEDVTAEEHCVPDALVAWGAPPNRHSLHIEICAEATYSREQWLSPQVWPAVANAAHRARELADRYGVPKVKIGPAQLVGDAHGICGHVDVSNAFHQSTHTDPGPGFPWPEFMAEVNNPNPTTTTGAFMALNDEQQAALAEDAANARYAILSLVKPSTDQIPGLVTAIAKLADVVATGRTDLTADELKQAVASALQENIVKVSVSVTPVPVP